MLVEKLKNHSSKILVFIINLLIMAVAFLVIKDNGSQNNKPVFSATDSAPPNQEIVDTDDPILSNQDDISININTNSATSKPKKNKNQNKNSAKVNSNINSPKTNANTNSANLNTNIDRRTRTS